MVRYGLATLVALTLAGCARRDTSAPPAGQDQITSVTRVQALASTEDVTAGEMLFAEHCAACHTGGNPKAPHREFHKMMSPRAIVDALTQGVMAAQGATLNEGERRQVAAYLTGADFNRWRPPAPAIACKAGAAGFDLTRSPQQTGWGYDTRRFVPAAAAGLAVADIPRLKLKWAFAFPYALRARSQPVTAMGAVFVGSQDGTVYAFDLKSGCARWTSQVSAEVRTAIVVEPWTAGQPPAHPPRLFFGDLMGRVYAMDAQSGRLLWRQRPEDHPSATITGTPLLHGDTLYVPVSSLEVTNPVDPKYTCCTFRGLVAALDAATGLVKWKHYTVDQLPRSVGKTSVGTAVLAPSGAPVWGSPTLDLRRGAIYFGSGENYSSPAMPTPTRFSPSIWQPANDAGGTS